VRRLQASCLAFCAVAAFASGGCGDGGAQSGATVSVYAASALCKEARQSGREAADLEVRTVCLPPAEKDGKTDLAVAGANARRVTEDSTSVALLEAPGPAAEFSQPIVEAADIAWVETSSGATAMRRVLAGLEQESSTPRQAVLDEVG
jgi:hypothetical protein